MELKVFELRWTNQGEKEWVAAYTNIGAIKTWLNVTSADWEDFEEDDEVVEIPKEQWEKYRVTNSEYDPADPEDKEEMTFREIMKGLTSPDIIAGTMYE